MIPLILLALAAPIPFPKINPGYYRLVISAQIHELELNGNKTYKLRRRGIIVELGDWKIEEGYLILKYGRLDALGLPTKRKSGFAHEMKIPIGGGEGWDAGDPTVFEISRTRKK